MVNEDQLYEKQLGIAHWYITHKILLRSILIVFLMVLDLILIVIFLYLLIFNLVINQKVYQANLRSFITPVADYALLRQTKLPPEISILNIQKYVNTNGYDIVAEINNPFTTWYATFDYQFQVGDKLTPIRRSFILPGEKKKIVALAVENGDLVSNLVFSNINWQKEINFAKLYQEKFKFDIRNVKFIPTSELGLGDKVPVSRVSFEIENLTAYNYKNLNLLIFLNSAGQITAVNQIPSGVINSSQVRSLEVNFFQKLPKIENIDIVPEANIFDSSIFLKL